VSETELAGKTALVTGASRGIGAATALALARAGVSRVLLHYNQFQEGAEQTLAGIRACGAEAASFQADLSTSGGIHLLIGQLRAAPPVDILVNNAGSLVRRATLFEMEEDLFDRVMNLNFKSAWMLTQALAAGMVERGSGIVVNVSSIGARNGGGAGSALYVSAKGAVSTMTRALSKELAPKGVRVNAVSPGVVDNYFHEQFSNRQFLDSFAKITPAGRLGTNEDIADVVVFLSSDAARFVHGQTIEVNGGLWAP
jgi:3-oxoacyl-[acyl-carrier protein] reductase